MLVLQLKWLTSIKTLDPIIRAIGESHDKVEKEIVDQTTRLMHHINEEAKRQFKEALTEYFEKTGGMHDLLKEMITVVQNRFDYGLTIEEIEDK